MPRKWRGQENTSRSFDGSDEGPESNRSQNTDAQLFLDDEDDSSSEDEEEVGFFIKVETMMGKSFQIFSYSSDSVEVLKTRIAFQEGIPQKDQNLFTSHGRIANPKSSLADLGFNEFSSRTKSLRLVTNISSGMGSKGFMTRNSSPPSSFLPLPIIPSLSSKRRNSNGNEQTNPSQIQDRIFNNTDDGSTRDEEPLRLPRLGLDEDNIDGVLVFKDGEDRRVFLIIKKHEKSRKPGEKINASKGNIMKSASTMTNSHEMDKWKSVNELNKRAVQNSGLYNARLRKSSENDALERVRENAKTLHKMNEIRNTLLNKKKLETLPPLNSSKNSPSKENNLPSIHENGFKCLSTLNQELTNRNNNNFPPTSSAFRKPIRPDKLATTTTFNRTITSSIATLNRLKAEIYLEAKRNGGGSYLGQLCRYVQLKVKILLAEQNPDEYTETNYRFCPTTEPKSLVPTVVIKRISERAEELSKSFLKSKISVAQTARRTSQSRTVVAGGCSSGRQRDSSTNSSSSISENILKETNHRTRVATAKRLLSDETIKSGRLRRQISQTGLASAIRDLKSAGRRPSSGNIRGTSSTIQKKKKDVVRCAECRKKVGLASRYQCRCGKIFCSIHRYAEVHSCTFDYKTEGRKQLEQANPLIIANKVDKI